MMTMKFIQIVGNLAIRNLAPRYPSLTVRFFAGKTGSQMRVFIADNDDPGQLTGRLYDLGDNPGLETLKVKQLAEYLEKRIDTEIRGFLHTRASR